MKKTGIYQRIRIPRLWVSGFQVIGTLAAKNSLEDFEGFWV